MTEEVKQPTAVKAEAVAPTPAPEVKPASEAELMKSIAEASAKGDFKAVAKIASELVKFQKTKETAEQDAKVKELEAITIEVGKAIKAALMPLYDAKKRREIPIYELEFAKT